MNDYQIGLLNKLGKTARVITEGLEPVRMENKRMTSVAERLQRATLGDNIDSRMRERIEEYRQEIKHKKSTGRMNPEEAVTIFAFNLGIASSKVFDITFFNMIFKIPLKITAIT